MDSCRWRSERFFAFVMASEKRSISSSLISLYRKLKRSSLSVGVSEIYFVSALKLSLFTKHPHIPSENCSTGDFYKYPNTAPRSTNRVFTLRSKVNCRSRVLFERISQISSVTLFFYRFNLFAVRKSSSVSIFLCP